MARIPVTITIYATTHSPGLGAKVTRAYCPSGMGVTLCALSTHTTNSNRGGPFKHDDVA